jgi:hypothetical protein
MDVKITVKYDFGDVVYLKTDEHQLQRIVTGYILRQRMIIYYLSCGTTETCHYDYEISKEKSTEFL